ncbi:MAG TPA: dipeptidase [Trueperaceae bacterium]
MPEKLPEKLPIFDGHNDVLLRLAERGQGPEGFLQRSDTGHLDLPRAREAGFAGGLFACFTPSAVATEPIVTDDGWERPMPEAPEIAVAQRNTLALAASLFRIERLSQGRLRVCRSVADIRECIESGVVAAVFHIEGAEAIDEDFHALEVFHQAGLRSLGPVWSRVNRFGSGVPFNYPGTPDIGPGLTELGKQLIRRCNELGILVDLSHLNERGFWDVARISDKPLVASHSNAHAICPVPRNLTDDQLEAIRDSGGLVGLNFAVAFLDPAGSKGPEMPLETMVRHVDHLLEKLGVNGVALGSDFDGCVVSTELGDVTGLPRLIEALRQHGYDQETLERICYLNWLDVLERTWA